jgi:glycosyltransferase involved in cell wall biosynthesis
LSRLRIMVELRVYERSYRRHVGLFSFVSPADRDAFATRNRGSEVITSPNGVDLDYFAGLPGPENSGPNVLFVGNLGFLPNETAGTFLLDKVAPRVWRSAPQAMFWLVGPDPSQRLLTHAGPRVKITGWVEDIRPHLATAAVVVVPMVCGTGIKNKILESWAAARPVVATPLACQGLPAVNGRNVLVGVDARQLAEGICRLLGQAELRKKLGAEGRRSVEKGFSWHSITAVFRDAVCQLTGAGSRKCR